MLEGYFFYGFGVLRYSEMRYSLGVLELWILLSLPPKWWNYSPILSSPAKNTYFVASS